jgi:hypothetical protein
MSYAWGIAFVISLSNVKMIHPVQKLHGHYQNTYDTNITVAKLQNDKLLIKKYVMERVASDIKKAKRWGKGMARAFGGINHYAFDAIPFEFFNDNRAIEEAFKRLEEGVEYIGTLKETFKNSIPGNKKRLNQSQLAEFLYDHIVDKLHVTDAQRALLKKEPLKMDEFVKKGIVKKDEYMYFTLLNFVIRYYLEQELKK